MTRKFQRTKEHFTCGHCGAHVEGDGYTNHCPKCLWSKHVDENPGDRLSLCGGMMEPVRIEKRHGGLSIVHVCLTCGAVRHNKASSQDDMDTLLNVARRAGEDFLRNSGLRT